MVFFVFIRKGFGWKIKLRLGIIGGKLWYCMIISKQYIYMYNKKETLLNINCVCNIILLK